MLSVLPTLEEEYELEDGAEEAHVREANKSYTTLIQYTFQKSLGSEEKSLMRDLITGLRLVDIPTNGACFETWQVQNVFARRSAGRKAISSNLRRNGEGSSFINSGDVLSKLQWPHG
ncbi:hypothetical protein CEXT_109662 [Caerostris extrusa]|uniref:Uncharacterized protein n=1 Tax=Caerostris extrusa TaxID=172846 RepID=A0AAV4M996_CAEEX|nr:hypothetical protein CEXT_109662 [Caerostris extrusa]